MQKAKLNICGGGEINDPEQTGGTSRLSPRAAELLSEQQAGLPVWIRSPKRGVDFYTGLSRSKLYECATKGSIRSVSIREPGQVKGTRLFHLQSILDFIERVETAARTSTEAHASPPGLRKGGTP